MSVILTIQPKGPGLHRSSLGQETEHANLHRRANTCDWQGIIFAAKRGNKE